MSLAHASSSAGLSRGSHTGRSSGDARRIARRRFLFLAGFVLLVAAAAMANYGPFQEWWATREKVQATEQRIATLEAEKTKLQKELAKLGDSAYLETLAREDLSYIRPGEDLFIVQGLEGTEGSGAQNNASTSTTGTEGVTGGADVAPTEGGDSPGLIERFLTFLSTLF